MKRSYGILFALAMIGAAISGWLIERQAPSEPAEVLEIPDDIDYYLAELDWQAFQRDGRTLYRLQSPYLEHYVREDISLLQQPSLRYFSDYADWSIASGLGRFRHEDDILEFEQQVKLSQLTGQEPIQVLTEKIMFESKTETIRFPRALAMSSPKLRLQADSGQLDLRAGQHQFFQVNAVYHENQDHEPG